MIRLHVPLMPPRLVRFCCEASAYGGIALEGESIRRFMYRRTGSNETWQVVQEDAPLSAHQSAPGIVDVHSGSEQVSLEGTPYSSW